MNAYIRLVSGATDKKFAVLWAGFIDGGIQRNENVQVSANGKLDVQQGAYFKYWQGTLKAYVTPLDSDYGSRADLEAFYTLKAPLNNLTFYDHHGDSHSVYLLGDWVPQSQTSMLDDDGNYFLIPVVIQSADAL